MRCVNLIYYRIKDSVKVENFRNVEAGQRVLLDQFPDHTKRSISSVGA